MNRRNAVRLDGNFRFGGLATIREYCLDDPVLEPTIGVSRGEHEWQAKEVPRRETV